VKSWVVVYKDGRYSYAWGVSAAEAQYNHLKEWSDGIQRIAPAEECRDQLPPDLYVPTVAASLRASPLEPPKESYVKGKVTPDDWDEELWGKG
jgi:hypothetical protein